jgi:hypothetical protein
MKYFICTLFLSLLVSFSFSQNNETTTAPDQTGGGSPTATIVDLQAKPMRLPSLQDIGGSPFLNADYKTGTIKLSDGRVVNNVPVKFNIFNNAIMIQKDGEELRLESFDLVSYDDEGNGGTAKHYSFKQGYPEIDNHPGTAIYQVLAFGSKVQLVKYISQKVEDAPTLGDYSRREIVTTQQLYIYVPGGEIKKIKTSKQAIIEALPGMSAKIEETTKSAGLNLKNESDIITLVNELNKE